MGKRSWKLKCKECNTEFWEWFEHMNADEIADFCNETNCPECDSKECIFTTKTRFSGGRVMESNKILVACKNCFDEWWLNIGDKSLSYLKDRTRSMSCVNCEESGEPEISDSIPLRYWW